MNRAALLSRQGQAVAWRWREREWSWIALLCAGLCLLFSVWPEVDLLLSRQFLQHDGRFAGNDSPLAMATYRVVPWVGRGLALLALLLAVLPRPWQARWLGPRWRRRLLALGLSTWLGVGLTVNGVLKEQWGRARPSEVVMLGGAASFSPALRPVEQCRSNCSFVSGHAATGFALMSIGLFGSPRQRRRWLLVGAMAGLAVGAGRIAQGGHFGSDVLFAGLCVWLCHALLREVWLRQALQRWRRR